MNVFRGIERWFHAAVLRHPQMDLSIMPDAPYRVVCYCSAEWWFNT